jgi:purine-cytosine permease-like protein
MRHDATNDIPDGIRPKRHHIRIAGRRMPIPRSRKARICIGFIFVILGMFGFLPILGFWMIPVGLLILSHDIPAVRRKRRQTEVWWYRRKDRRAASPKPPKREPS